MKIPAFFLVCALAPVSTVWAGEAASAAAKAASTEAKADGAAAKSTVIYRQVLPDGRIVYADKAVPGAKADQTITVDPATKGGLWSTEPPERRPAITQKAEPTPVRHVDTLPPAGKRYVPESQRQAATLEVMRAEMLVEDAKKRQAAGVAPQAAELRDEGGGGQRYNQAYYSRQKLLARDVAYAEQELKKAQAARDSLR